MKDRDFLIWIHERLEHVGEDPLADHMHKLRAIIYATDEDQLTPNRILANSLSDLKKLLDEPTK